MDSFRYDYAVIGGDLRLSFLAEELSGQADVCHFALCRPVCAPGALHPVKSAPSLEACASGAKSVICPVPMSRDRVLINGSKKNISVQQILSLLTQGQRFYAGCIPEEFNREAIKKGVLTYDLMSDDALAYFNTVATAEGVICEAIRESPVNLFQSRCAVTGYGKCGRSIAEKLKNLSCLVTVFSSSPAELAQAVPFFGQVCDLRALSSRIGDFDFVFNTVPAMTLSGEILAKASPSVTILDIASAPGGVDFSAAKELSLNAKSCPALPGTYAPLSSARAIASSIHRFERSSSCL